MAVSWDAGTAIAGGGDVSPGSPFVRVELDVIPGSFSRSSDTPARYYNLGVVGAIDGDYRSPGARLLYAAQEFPIDLVENTALYWVLPIGVEGTLYRGFGVGGSEAVGCTVRRSVGQSLVDATDTIMSFDTDLHDPSNMHDPATTPTKITVPVAGWYHIAANVGITVNVACRVSMYVRKNDSTNVLDTVQYGAAGGGSIDVQVSGVWQLNAGDYLELHVTQSSGGTRTAFSFQSYLPSMSVVRVA